MSTQKYYAALLIEQDRYVRQIRETVWDWLEPEGYRKVTPHVTIHPGFKCDPHRVGAVSELLADVMNTSMPVEGVEFFPSQTEPHVVMLDIGIGMSIVRDEIESLDGIEPVTEPVPLHLTLFKPEKHGESALRSMPSGVRGSVEGAFDGWSAMVDGFEVRRRG